MDQAVSAQPIPTGTDGIAGANITKVQQTRKIKPEQINAVALLKKGQSWVMKKQRPYSAK